jgi:hypothetical protein
MTALPRAFTCEFENSYGREQRFGVQWKDGTFTIECSPRGDREHYEEFPSSLYTDIRYLDCDDDQHKQLVGLLKKWRASLVGHWNNLHPDRCLECQDCIALKEIDAVLKENSPIPRDTNPEATVSEQADAIRQDVLANHLPRIAEGLLAGYPDENQALIVYDHLVRMRILGCCGGSAANPENITAAKFDVPRKSITEPTPEATPSESDYRLACGIVHEPHCLDRNAQIIAAHLAPQREKAKAVEQERDELLRANGDIEGLYQDMCRRHDKSRVREDELASALESREAEIERLKAELARAINYRNGDGSELASVTAERDKYIAELAVRTAERDKLREYVNDMADYATQTKEAMDGEKPAF